MKENCNTHKQICASNIKTMDDKKLIRTLIIVIFILVIIYSLLRVGAGLDLSLGPYIK